MWARQEILESIQGQVFGNLATEFTGVSIDTRTLAAGSIFFAIEGANFDGHDFLSNAVSKGATLLIIQKDKLDKAKNLAVPFIAVDGVLRALEQLATKARARSKAKIIAVTGSLGKTTLKELLKHVLSVFGKTHASPASFNNHWGVPLTLASMPIDTEYGIFELGMNHAGELAYLAPMVKQDISVITAIAPAHLGNFEDLQAIAAAKAEIYAAQNKHGLALVNIDDNFCEFLTEQAKINGIENIEFFGRAKKAQYRILAFKDKLLRYSKNSECGEIKLAIARDYAAYNSMALMAILDFLCLDVAQAQQALANFEELGGRGKEHQLILSSQSKALLIDESYNANPRSMVNALENLGHKQLLPGARKIAVLGDMLELGSFSEEMHRALAKPILAAGVNKLYLIGPNMQPLALELGANCVWHETVEEILSLILSDIRDGDVIMVKSSKSIGTIKVVNELLNIYKLKSLHY
ncbi:UDP-N-acetylmuramoyl-tripeptide--D-alanyl-D-alanine ligase [Bartonella sp. TP]|uniref:UDP-N-acetylmuramoyl-tripeptide--D-alanyl-D- alanine ligase n=1 Tax=Bartonella sp. TP TaxID=3057550 RepID=UPI0025AF29FC|nr:UDP-N-acetylmuramoyl-tripeptide--D-alanyl-D-alanine ligase [Bartonella sp. TP]WJW79759.1 UDP-N-acetylmuramoyl-tripeptide--D-alanyl-D-alanine ligase [Bartonella sp. TP]